MAIFRLNSNRILTKDADIGRINSDMSAALTPSKNKVVFYSKNFKSGRLSDSRVTFTLPFRVSVGAGFGTINNHDVTWSPIVFDAPKVSTNSFLVVCVDIDGVVDVRADMSMTSISDSIVLAYINVGSTEIVNLEEVEKDGWYIYARLQSPDGSWDDHERVLCTGDQPRAFSRGGIIYLTYRKDGRTLIRLFDTGDDQTWAYTPNIFITDNQSIIHLKKDPESSIYAKCGLGSYNESTPINDNLFPLGETSFCFIGGAPHVFVPMITGPYTDKIIYPYHIDVYRNGVVEQTLEFNDNHRFYLDERWLPIPDVLNRSFRVRVNSTIVTFEFETSPVDAVTTDVFEPFYNPVTGEATDNRLSTLSAMGQIAEVEKVFEYQETRSVSDEEMVTIISLGGSEYDIFTYMWSLNLLDENTNISGGLGSISETTIT